jgi:hypothetical protein
LKYAHASDPVGGCYDVETARPEVGRDLVEQTSLPIAFRVDLDLVPPLTFGFFASEFFRWTCFRFRFRFRFRLRFFLFVRVLSPGFEFGGESLGRGGDFVEGLRIRSAQSAEKSSFGDGSEFIKAEKLVSTSPPLFEVGRKKEFPWNF